LNKVSSYYPGCSLHSMAKEFNVSSKAAAAAVGLELRELEDWNCCGSHPTHNIDELIAAGIAARNLRLAEKTGSPSLIAPCPSCYNRLKMTDYEMRRNEKFFEEVNNLLDEPYELGVNVRTILQAFYEEVKEEDIRSTVKVPLEGLKVACYYGCLITRPPEVTQFDDAENPISMDELIFHCGAEPVDFQYKVECCGGAFGIAPHIEFVLEKARDILEMAVDCKADVIAVACPLCQQNLDMREGQINSRYKTNYRIPVVYFTQLLGLSFGISYSKLMLNKHLVSSRKILSEKIKGFEKVAI